ncbi:response regulator [Ramlibacter sp. CGMCC 1.13660]|nr:response regulator [Ramlibacter sp. CGMCC 1.13660]MBA2960554.1 response regulator [Ramlibacter sp. CGMCC 1.13660]
MPMHLPTGSLFSGGDAGPEGTGPTDWEPQHLFSPARGRYTVLVVDDQAAKRYAIARALRAAGYAVDEAPSGAAALQAFGHHAAVVLDVYLPDLDGFAVCRALRLRAPALPIVQVSSVLVDAQYQQAGRAAGASAYLADPELTALVATVDQLLGVRIE